MVKREILGQYKITGSDKKLYKVNIKWEGNYYVTEVIDDANGELMLRLGSADAPKDVKSFLESAVEMCVANTNEMDVRNFPLKEGGDVWL